MTKKQTEAEALADCPQRDYAAEAAQTAKIAEKRPRRKGCEALGCPLWADWELIEGEPMFLCRFHGGEASVEGWRWIGEYPPEVKPVDVCTRDGHVPTPGLRHDLLRLSMVADCMRCGTVLRFVQSTRAEE